MKNKNTEVAWDDFIDGFMYLLKLTINAGEIGS